MSNDNPPRYRPLAIGSVVLGFFGLFGIVIGSILAIVFGRHAQSLYDPDRHDRNLGRIGEVLGYIGVAAFGLGVIMFVIVKAT